MQKIINFLDNTSNQPSKFKTKNLGEINDEPQEMYGKDNQVGFKTSILGSRLCNYSELYILFKGILTVENTICVGVAANNADKKVIFKNISPSSNCISKTNKMRVEDAHDIDVTIPTYNVIEYSDNY